MWGPVGGRGSLRSGHRQHAPARDAHDPDGHHLDVLTFTVLSFTSVSRTCVPTRSDCLTPRPIRRDAAGPGLAVAGGADGGHHRNELGADGVVAPRRGTPLPTLEKEAVVDVVLSTDTSRRFR